MTKCCIAIACLLGLLIQHAACATLAAKQLAGPPSEFPQHVLPTPKAGTLQQQSTYTTSTLACEEKLCGWTTPLVVDNNKEFRFGVFSPFEAKLTYSLVDPNGNQVPIENYANPSQYQLNSDGSVAVPGIVYQIKNPIVGKYQFSVASKEHIGQRENDLPHVAVIVWNESPIEINTRLNSYSMKVGADVGLVSYVADTNVDASAALQEVITTAEMVVLEPDGEELDVEMHDDGLHYDLDANDGVYGAFIKPTVPGTYRLQAVVSGKTSSGVEFTRSTEHVIPVVDAELILDSVANSKIDSNGEVLNIYLPLSTVKNTNDADTFRPYAEVWGTDSNNNLVPACWISTITGIQEVDGAQVLPVQLNMKWLTLAKVQAPLVLKNVYVQDAATFVPVTTATQIAVKTQKNFGEILALPHLASVTEITKEMKVGKNPLPPKSGADKSGIVLVHGYCADNNQFKKYGSDVFTDAYYFENLSANNPNDKFALLIKDFAEQQGLTSFGLIAHSQGGLASIHLHNYYWSGLEVAQGNRLIQSVGSPYQGNGGAGTAADLGKMFGVSCGANTDMTKDGAALWLSGITTDTRKDTFYFTTTYEQGNFFGDWCNFAMNLILKWPNDGVAEYDLAQLPNANNMGNKEKWCHSVDMSYSPQCSDPARNADMNTNAAR